MRSAFSRALLLLGLALAAHGPALRNGYVWDDDLYVTANPTVQEPGGLERTWLSPTANPQYYPLVFTSFWLEFRLWGLEPLGYHLVNVLLHAINVLLLFKLLERLKVPGAAWAAALFAVHPVHVESVAWITERKNVLSGLFYLAAALAYLAYDRAADGPERRRTVGLYALASVLFAGALLSKSVTASLPAALLLVLWWKERLTLRSWLRLLPLFILGAAAGLHTARLERTHVGAAGLDFSLSFVERCVVAGRAIVFYLGKLLWPDPLIFSYARWEIDAGSLLQILHPVGVIGVLVGLWVVQGRIGRAPLVALLYFVGTLFPVLGFLDVYPMRFSFVADHFQYLASIGPIALLAGCGASVAWGTRRRRAAAICGSAVILVLAALCWRQIPAYRDDARLWEDTLAKNPQSWMALTNLGLLHEREGDYTRALDLYREAARIRPGMAQAHNNLGVVLLKRHELDAAKVELERALELDPRFSQAHHNLGLLAFERGQWAVAAERFERSIELDPDFPAAREALVLARARLAGEREAGP